MLSMKKHACDELAGDPTQRDKFYQDEISRLELDKNLAMKEKSEAEKNSQLVQRSIKALRERLVENDSQNQSM